MNEIWRLGPKAGELRDAVFRELDVQSCDVRFWHVEFLSPSRRHGERT